MIADTQRIIDRRTGRPQLHWDNNIWGCYFAELKKSVPPILDPGIRRLPLARHHLKTGEEYKGETAYQQYCSFINDVLTSIRKGETDYCYFIYQIADLLQFEPELQTRLCNEDRLCPYFEVWLDTAGGNAHCTNTPEGLTAGKECL